MRSSSRHPIITGAAILTFAGIITRLIGFFYKIFLSRVIGAEGLGIYQLVFPVYAFCFSLAAAGVQTGISRCCAAAFAENNPAKARAYFSAGLIFSFTVSAAAAFGVYSRADRISILLLKEARCEPLLRLISLSIPLGTIHTCVSAWYFSKSRTAIPSAAQLLEQFARVFSSFLLYQIFLEKGWEPSPILAAAGVLAGEMVSSLFTGICLMFHFQSREYDGPLRFSRIKCGKELILLSMPLTANRLLLTLLQSFESIIIPGRLKMSGLTSAQALSIYGILTGMALPFILFPSAITGSVSTILLPTIAGEQAKGNQEKIRSATENTIKYCLLLGIFASGVFFCFGDDLGTIIYTNLDAGTFIRILSFLCPFLYLTGTLSSILNGLGHTGLCFLQNAAGLGIRILFAVFFIPRFGITGYLWGLLASQLFITALNICFVRGKVPFSFRPVQWLLLPAAALILGCAAGYTLFQLLLRTAVFPALLSLLTSLAACGIIYLLALLAMGLITLK